MPRHDHVALHFEAHQSVVRKTLGEMREAITATAGILVPALRDGHRVMAFGNGGSAAQAAHLVGELIGRFDGERSPLPALNLTADAAVTTCISNDFGFEHVFERQVEALVRPGDVVVGLTTSGRSEDVRRGLAAAHRATTIALTGAAGLHGVADHVLAVPTSQTAVVQEVHLMIVHVWCRYVDEAFGC